MTLVLKILELMELAVSPMTTILLHSSVRDALAFLCCAQLSNSADTHHVGGAKHGLHLICHHLTSKACVC